MRTKQNGNAFELLCEADDQPFAEGFTDRLVIYSYLHGRIHSSALGVAEIKKVLDVARSSGFLKLEGC